MRGGESVRQGEGDNAAGGELGPVAEEPPVQGECPQALSRRWLLAFGAYRFAFNYQEGQFINLNITRYTKIQVIPLTTKLYFKQSLVHFGELGIHLFSSK